MLRKNHNTKVTTCMADRDIIRYLRKIAFKAAKKFNLKLKSFSKFPIGHKNITDTAGVCEHTKEIYINLYNRETGAYFSLESLIDTVLHEVAHLKFSHGKHDRKFNNYLKKIRKWYLEEK